MPVETRPPADVPASGAVPRQLLQPADVVAAKLEPAAAPPSVSARMRVAQILACSAVEARQCVGAQTVFSLSQNNNPYIWMEVHSQTLPYVLKHVYYHEGKIYSEVPLAITYPRMRTWSNVTLHSPTHVGSWRVEIVATDGTVLDQVTFRVTP